MDIIEKFLHKVSYKFPKGYPDISDPKDKTLLFELIDNLPLKEQSENFNALIQKTFEGNIPQAKGKYQIQPGPFTIVPEDQEAFIKLFKVKPNAGVGNGEVSLYWLFNTSGGSAAENRGGSAADLVINGEQVEVKSYPKHNTKITLGKFKDDSESRTIITRLFGVQNLVGALREASGKNFVSEVSFNINNIKDSFDKVFEIEQVLSDPKVEPILSQFAPFQELKKEINYLLGLVEGGDSQDLAKATMATLATNKIQLKPGPGNYILNLLTSNPLDIYIHKIPNDIKGSIMDKSYEQVGKATSVSSAEIQFNFALFD